VAIGSTANAKGRKAEEARRFSSAAIRVHWRAFAIELNSCGSSLIDITRSDAIAPEAMGCRWRTTVIACRP
jgi:hypothetical protein